MSNEIRVRKLEHEVKQSRREFLEWLLAVGIGVSLSGLEVLSEQWQPSAIEAPQADVDLLARLITNLPFERPLSTNIEHGWIHIDLNPEVLETFLQADSALKANYQRFLAYAERIMVRVTEHNFQRFSMPTPRLHVVIRGTDLGLQSMDWSGSSWLSDAYGYQLEIPASEKQVPQIRVMATQELLSLTDLRKVILQVAWDQVTAQATNDLFKLLKQWQHQDQRV